MVYAATAAGVCAAVAAARAGAQVILAEPGHHVGGMTSGGLGYTDVGDPRTLGGMAAEFRQAVADHYGVPVGHYAGPEPHVAEAIFTRWLEATGVRVVFGVSLASVEGTGRIEGVRLHDGSTIRAGVYIDAGYEGDLLAASGVPTTVGREGRSQYGELFAGRQELLPGRHATPPWISPFVADVRGIQQGAILPQIRDEPLAEVGAGDGGVMSYGYRVCMTTAADRVPFRRRAGFDDTHWELGRRLFHAAERRGDIRPAGHYVGLEPNLPAGKVDGNSLGPFSLNVLEEAHGSIRRHPRPDANRCASTTSATPRTSSGSSPTTPACPRRCVPRCSTGGCPATSSPTPTTCPTSCTCARHGACSASRC